MRRTKLLKPVAGRRDPPTTEKPLSRRAVRGLLDVGPFRFAAFFLVAAVVFSVAIVMTIDLLWDGRLSAELEFAGAVTPFLDALLLVVPITAMLSELREEIVRRKEAEVATRLLNAELEVQSRLLVAAKDDLVRSSEARYRLLLDHAPVGIFHYDADLVVTFCNERFVSLMRSKPGALIGLDAKTLMDQSVVPAMREALAGEIGTYEGRYVATLSNVDAWLEMTCAPARDGKGQITGGVGIVQDVGRRKRSDDALRIAATAFEAQEGILIADGRGAILRVNNAFNVITGYSAEEVVGKDPRLFATGEHDAAFWAAMWARVSATGSWEGEIRNLRKDGTPLTALLRITTVRDDDGTLTNYVITFTDITVSSKAAAEIERLAFYDPLTGLPNRRLLMDRLQQAFASSARSGQEGAVLFVDLDHFKRINDTIGHAAGDTLLQQVARRLKSRLRQGDTVARLGGDEFVVMLENLSDQPAEAARQVRRVAETLIALLHEPYQIAGQAFHSGASIGAALFSDHGDSGEELLKRADIAMYQAKTAGRNALRFFNPRMQDLIDARAALEGELRRALESQQLQLHFQIQLDASRHPLGAEALIRWLHPQRGLVPPVQFIPLAEETGLIVPIGQWVLEMACARLEAWAQDALTRDLSLSVNVSAGQFHQTDFAAKVQALVQRHGVVPGRLTLELTESLLLKNVEETVATMGALKALGVRFSLDDFGTGYSSLQYLKRLPLDELKIDQSFVRGIGGGGSDKEIVRTVIAMARGLGLDVIAEGVETEEQRQLLLDMGCARFQGYLFGRPVPIDQFEARLTQQPRNCPNVR